MTTPDTLFDDVDDARIATTTGKWFPIRMTPDLITGEILNIGVGFVDSKRHLHVRLIESARPLQCLYGPQGLENFTFLLTILREHLQKHGKAESPSPHITFGARQYASGDSPEDILNRLFDTMVTLNQADEGDLDETGAKRIDTQALRKMVYKAAKKSSEAIYNRLFKHDPVILKDAYGTPHELDLPIFAPEGDLFRDGPRYGTFVSAYFRSPVYRGFNLDGGVRNLWNTRAILPKTSRGGLFILRPPEGSKGYSGAIINEIENDIDRATWPFLKMKGMHVEVSTDPGKLAECGLALAH